MSIVYLFLAALLGLCNASPEKLLKGVYIVELSQSLSEFVGTSLAREEIVLHAASIKSHHESILASLKTSNSRRQPPKMIYSYPLTNAFSASLSPQEADKLKKHPDVKNVTEDAKLKLATTDSNAFMNLGSRSGGAWTKSNGSKSIIGVLDNGIWPEHSSFRDTGYGPVPTRFKGICQTGENFSSSNCNRKIIGARYFSSGFYAPYGYYGSGKNYTDYGSARGKYGHGTHVASVAAGTATSANITGRNFGIARGVAYGARLSIYKVCWKYYSYYYYYGSGSVYDYCAQSDVLAAINQAVLDGVDVIVLSLEGYYFGSYLDPVSESCLEAIRMGVGCIAASGNTGTTLGTVSNIAPWMLTAGASTTSRSFIHSLILGTGERYSAAGIASGLRATSRNYSIIEGARAYGNYSSEYQSLSCSPGSLTSDKIRGKIVFCENTNNYYYSSYYYSSESALVSMSKEVYDKGGVGMISYNPFEVSDVTPTSDFYYVPTFITDAQSAKAIRRRLRRFGNLNGIITGSKKFFEVRESPVVASFSGLGPGGTYIIKPDIIAPGVDIIAATAPTSVGSDLPFKASSSFAILSGSSIAAAQVAGAYALIKSYRSSWPPSWIFSAIITTGNLTSDRGLPIMHESGYSATPFHMGGGHMNVNAAMNPGLVFGITAADYDAFACSYRATLNGYPNYCQIREIDLNVPWLSMYALRVNVTVTRRMTLVDAPANYTATVKSPPGTRVSISPSRLAFTTRSQTLRYTIRVVPITPSEKIASSLKTTRGFFTFGSIVWKSSSKSVNFNIAINVPNPGQSSYYYSSGA